MVSFEVNNGCLVVVMKFHLSPVKWISTKRVYITCGKHPRKCAQGITKKPDGKAASIAFCMPNQVPAPHGAGNTPSGY